VPTDSRAGQPAERPTSSTSLASSRLLQRASDRRFLTNGCRSAPPGTEGRVCELASTTTTLPPPPRRSATIGRAGTDVLVPSPGHSCSVGAGVGDRFGGAGR